MPQNHPYHLSVDITHSSLYKESLTTFLLTDISNEKTNFKISKNKQIVPEIPREKSHGDNMRVIVIRFNDDGNHTHISFMDDSRLQNNVDVDKVLKDATSPLGLSSLKDMCGPYITTILFQMMEQFEKGELEVDDVIENASTDALAAILCMALNDPLDVLFLIYEKPSEKGEGPIQYTYLKAVKPRPRN